MSVLIKDMEMPKDGELLCVGIYPDGKVCINLDLSCKQVATAVPVPPHGDLIDRDALSKSLDRLCDRVCQYSKAQRIFMCRACPLGDAFAVVDDDAPTIIPASEEGVKTEDDSDPWLCLSCRNYPPSSTDGKPCSQCNPSEVLHSCYDPAEEGE